ncbi:caldesmon isoform X5 [Cygnus olor]|uniref:caldesmon isoform X5 n=1 Tax=Cygnus olor TaxID=8869 RepID=UPI001ADE4EAD|nr:caldesmon isoform X5 [Cygnus olor]XP_040419370.1 caldesmon isoform X5 [Cygnus olor]XP_040419377.1 caldesmon isoform X5 [Cygnus olor]XP_040419386.1 caldesmon isoform X5 [Cygnus olor]XP_040419394.1 caldesmon isoform X5 [Cygnus olor]XP_040419402.1 caldesmon isoform X5 [Cygnus olor]XP_040419413.1 caldesmon isoform X5 [Cygnus olor]XP_040419422.1 caldesmon isoform X5 [Cygnus olor]
MDDFERRRELRRQKREEMRLEAERLSYQRNDDDDEEAARERRRRARQERLRQKEEEDLSGDVTEKSEVNAQNSVAEDETKRTTTRGTDDEAALLERLARREERRQKRLQEALERQKEFDPTITDGSLSVPSRREVNNVEENETTGKEEKVETRRGRYETEETETVTKSYQRNNWRQDGEEDEKKEEKDKEEAQEDKPKEVPIEENQVKDKDKEKAPKEEMKSVWDRKKGVPEQKAQNGERELTSPKLKSTENAFGRSNLKGIANAEEAKAGSQVDAGKRLDDLRRRQGENEKEDFEKLKEKQQEAAVELEELKKRREERRKILEEEEQKKKQEEAERKAREEEEKRRMKEEIERRRAEAAEKRQKVPEDGVSEEKKPFKCFSPKGSSLKIEERAEFLNKSAQKSGMKPTHTTAVVSKIDSRLEQYTSAVVGTKAAKPAKPAASDLPVPAEGVRNIKSMWEKGNVFSSPSGGTGASNKETAGLKVGVSSRINEWLTKTPESNKSPAPKPSDLRPGDVSGKRNLWEKQSVDKPAASSSKVTAAGKKSETNGLRQLEKEP